MEIWYENQNLWELWKWLVIEILLGNEWGKVKRHAEKKKIFSKKIHND